VEGRGSSEVRGRMSEIGGRTGLKNRPRVSDLLPLNWHKRKKEIKLTFFAARGVGQPILTQAIACIFFRRVHADGTCPGTANSSKTSHN